MSVANGNLANQTTFNNAFMSRTGDTSTTGAITQSNTTQSTTKDTGAIVTEGGVGIEKNLNVGGTIKNADTTTSTTKDTGAIVTEGGLGVEENINAGGNITATGTMAASNLSGTNTGDVVLGNVGSAPNATGATLSGQNLNLEPADATNPGVVSTGAQSFAGDKTFVDDVIITGDLTVNGTTTTLNTVTLDVEDVNITVNNGGNDASSEGAGLTVERTTTNATILHADALASKFKCGAAGSESEIMTVGSTQTITGSKTITTPMTYEEEGSAPSTPSAGYRKLYAKSDGFYSLNSSGVEEQIGSGGGGSGGINYIDNPNAVTDTTGWAAYADAAGSVPVDGTGGSPNSTFTRSTSSPLRDAASFLFTKNSGASRQGEGFSYAFTIDAADKGKVLQGSFDYAIASGTFVDDEMEVFVYDVTNASLIYCSPSKLKNHSLAAEKFGFEFQTSSSSTSYRLIVHVGVSTDSSNTIKFDNFSVGPQAKLYGSPVTDWVSWTPTGSWVTNTTYTGYKRQIGDTYEYEIKVATSGAPTSTSLTVTLQETIDTAKLSDTTIGILGHASISDSGALSAGVVRYSSSTVVAVAATNTASTYADAASVTQAVPFTFGAGDYVILRFRVPIVGKSSSAIMSSDADTRVVALAVTGDPASATSGNPIIFPTVTYDTHGGYNASTGRYTVQTPGFYRVHGYTNGDAAAITLKIYKNAVAGPNLGVTMPTYFATPLSGTVQCVAGDILDIRPDGTYNASGTSYLYIEKLQGPAQIAASETVSAFYTGTPTGSLGASLNTATYPTKVRDTHGAYSSGTYTVPANGVYNISAGLSYSGATVTSGNVAAVQIAKNGAGIATKTLRAVETSANGTQSPSVSIDSYPLLAGDLITIKSYCGYTTPAFGALLDASEFYFSIVRTGNY